MQVETAAHGCTRCGLPRAGRSELCEGCKRQDNSARSALLRDWNRTEVCAVCQRRVRVASMGQHLEDAHDITITAEVPRANPS